MEKHLRVDEESPVDHPFDDPFGDDLGEQLAKMAPRQYLTRGTLILASLVLLLAGFVAGAQVQKRYGTTGSTTAASTGRAGGNFGGGNFGGGNVGGGGQNAGGQQAQPSRAANLTTGTVKLVDGATVYVQLANGDVITVRTTTSTVVALTQPGSLKDLPPGAQITVEGAPAAEGTVNATKVTKDR